MGNALKLDAPIVPGKSAAGIFIGDHVDDILLQVQPFLVTDLSDGKRYRFGSVNIWANSNGKVEQIGLYSGYQGKTAETIGIGSTIGEVIASLGVVAEDEEDNLVVLGQPGWCFESSQWQSAKQAMPDQSATVVEIFVFAATNQRIDNPQYPTICPQCGREMRFDLILKGGRGVHSLHVSPSPLEDDVLGYGFYCTHCQRGWTGDELLKMAKD